MKNNDTLKIVKMTYLNPLLILILLVLKLL